MDAAYRTCIYTGMVKAGDVNGGKYLVEVRAESGDTCAYRLEFRQKSADTGMKSIVLNEGKIAHYNVNMAVESIYEAFLPRKDAKIKITPKDKYAKSREIGRASCRERV